MITLAWPFVGLVFIACATWLGFRALVMLTASSAFETRLRALETTKDELEAAVLVHRGVVERIQDADDRIGKLEMERGLGGQ